MFKSLFSQVGDVLSMASFRRPLALPRSISGSPSASRLAGDSGIWTRSDRHHGERKSARWRRAGILCEFAGNSQVIPIRWPYRPVMSRSGSKRTGIVLAIMGGRNRFCDWRFADLRWRTECTQFGKAPSALVLSSAYARGVGYPKTVQAAANRAVTNEKGCSTSIEAVYEDAAGKTGLISDLLKCNSPAAAAKVLVTFRKSTHVASSIGVPVQLGTTAFATASSAPEYLVAWQVGSGVALTAVDVDIAASSNSSDVVVRIQVDHPIPDESAHRCSRSAELLVPLRISHWMVGVSAGSEPAR